MICYKFGWYSIFYQRQKKTTELCQFEPVVIYFKYDFLWIGSKGKPFRDMYQLLNIHVLYWLSSITPCMKTLVHQGSYENWRIIKSVFVVYGTEMIYSFTWFIANNLNFISLFLLWYRFIYIKQFLCRLIKHKLKDFYFYRIWKSYLFQIDVWKEEKTSLFELYS